MAKSLRSKWRRKMRAVKRERYGAKENDRLIKMLQQAGDYQVIPPIKEEALEIDDGNPLDTTIQIEDITPATENENERPKRTKLQAAHDKRRLSRRRSRLDTQSDEDGEKNMETEKEDLGMEVEKKTEDRIYNKRTKRDQFGQYPVWLSTRKIGKQKKKNKRLVSKAKKLKTKKK